MKVEKPIMVWGSRVERRGLNSLKDFRRKKDFKHRAWSEIGADWTLTKRLLYILLELSVIFKVN